jgi:hypothetical protein
VRERVATHRYVDPLDQIWLAAGERIGLRVKRTADAYASTPGDGVLLLGDRGTLDPDDSVAQMVFHELCHSLVEGEASFERRDWGLDNEGDRDVPREQACLRLQAALASRYGLSGFFAPTTDFRAFYDALGPYPLEPATDPTTHVAISGLRRAEKPPWAPHLEAALEATRAVVDAVRPFAGSTDDRRDLFQRAGELPPKHPAGFHGFSANPSNRTCGSCAWFVSAKNRCRHAGNVRVLPEWAACERWQGPLDCQECGACCRAAYDLVQVSRRDPVRKKHPELVVVRGPYLEIARKGDRCVALTGGDSGRPDGAPFEPFACTIYGDRPKSCRDFERGGEHCLTARRRVGLTL